MAPRPIQQNQGFSNPQQMGQMFAMGMQQPVAPMGYNQQM